MNLREWEAEIEKAFKSQGAEYTPELREMMHSPTRLETKAQDMQVVVHVTNAMGRYFWGKVIDGATFGDVARVKETFGKTLEENYGLSSGPFLDLAHTYWTYQIEVQDLFPEYHDKWIGQALKAVEINIRQVFFPTPSPIMSILAKQRRQVQREYLKKFAPTFDIERFLAENPMLQADKRSGCLGSVAMMAVIAVAGLAVSYWMYWI